MRDEEKEEEFGSIEEEEGPFMRRVLGMNSAVLTLPDGRVKVVLQAGWGVIPAVGQNREDVAREALATFDRAKRGEFD